MCVCVNVCACVCIRDSKPGAYLPKPGFGFGKPPNPGFGSGSGLERWRPYTSKTANEVRHLWHNSDWNNLTATGAGKELEVIVCYG